MPPYARGWAALAAFAAVSSFACSRSVPPSALSPAREPFRPALDPDAPLRVSPPASPAPPWFDPSIVVHPLDPLTPRTAVGVGTHASLVSARAGRFVVHDQWGVVGPLAPPTGSIVVGLDGDDAVLAARVDGTLLRADNAHAALAPERFSRRGAVPGATAWDASGAVVAAAAGHEVAVSSDGGATFVASVPSASNVIDRVFARADGVVVAFSRAGRGPEGKTFLSTDRGRSWSVSSFQPGAVARLGPWVWNANARCPAVLGANAQWVRVARPRADAFARGADATPLLESSEIVRAHAGRAHASFVTPAPSSEEGLTLRGPEGDCGAAPALERPAVAAADPCAGAACLRGVVRPPPAPARTSLALLADGECAPDAADSEGTCGPAARLTRAPHAVVRDVVEATATLVDLPAACSPARLFSAAGLGVLLCDDASGERAVYAADRTGAFQPEGMARATDLTGQSLSVGADGTLALVGDCKVGGGCDALVRAPAAIGQPSAWRPVSVPGALTYRALTAGAVLVLAATPPAPAPAYDLLVVDASGGVRHAGAVTIAGDAEAIEVVDGMVVVTVRAGASSARLVVTNAGRLRPFGGSIGPGEVTGDAR